MTALLPCLVFSRKAWRALLYCCCCIIDGNLANAYRCLVSYTRCCTSIPDTWYPNITLLLDYVQQYSIIRTCEYEWSTHLSFVFYQRECTRCQVPGKTAVPGTCCTRYLLYQVPGIMLRRYVRTSCPQVRDVCTSAVSYLVRSTKYHILRSTRKRYICTLHITCHKDLL